MLKKIFFASFLLLPSVVMADRFGSIRSGADVPLSTQTIRNQSTNQSGAVFNVSSASIAALYWASNKLDLSDPGFFSLSVANHPNFLSIGGLPGDRPALLADDMDLIVGSVDMYGTEGQGGGFSLFNASDAATTEYISFRAKQDLATSSIFALDMDSGSVGYFYSDGAGHLTLNNTPSSAGSGLVRSTEIFNSSFGSGVMARSTSSVTDANLIGYTYPLKIYGKVPSAGSAGRLAIPFYYDFETFPIGDTFIGQIVADAGTMPPGFGFMNSGGTETFKLQFGGASDGFGGTITDSIGLLPQGASYLKNSLDINGSIGVPTALTSGNLFLGSTHYYVRVDATSSNKSIFLPDLNQQHNGAVERRWYRVCKVDSSTNTVSFSAGTSDTMDMGADLTVQNECVELIGRVGFSITGSISDGVWSEAGRSVRGGLYGDISLTGNLYAADVIGSGVGSYGYQGTTITYAAPPIDSVDRIPILNSGAVSWPLAVTDGAQLGSSQAFSNYNQFTSTRGVTVSYGIVAGSVTANDFSANTLVYADANHKLSSATVSGATFSGGVLTVTASGSGDSLGTHVATQTLSLNGNNITNLSSVTYQAGGANWIFYGSTDTMLLSDFQVNSGTNPVPGLTVNVVAHSTYSFQFDMFVTGTGSSGAGVKYAVDVPDDFDSMRWIGGGTSNANTASRFDQTATTDLGLNGTALSNVNSSTGRHAFGGRLVTGNSNGTIIINFVPQGSNYTVRAGSALHVQIIR